MERRFGSKAANSGKNLVTATKGDQVITITRKMFDNAYAQAGWKLTDTGRAIAPEAPPPEQPAPPAQQAAKNRGDKP